MGRGFGYSLALRGSRLEKIMQALAENEIKTQGFIRRRGRPSHPELAAEDDTVLNEIIDAIRGIQFGQVQIIIQDGRVVQIDRTEKRRLI
jgi:hypothetical protein